VNEPVPVGHPLTTGERAVMADVSESESGAGWPCRDGSVLKGVGWRADVYVSVVPRRALVTTAALGL